MPRPRPVAVTTGLALAVLVLTGCASPPTATAPAPVPAATTPAPGTGSPRAAPETGVADVAESLAPSVVTVLTGTGNGSGVVYRNDGHIITNEHVVRGATTVTLVFADATRGPARVVATDPITDIAVLRAEGRDLPAARFATALPRVGDTAIAVGSPLGFTNTVTAGIVSGLARAIPGSASAGNQALVDLIQTDAAISPGSSGGALADRTGTVIGINEAYIPPQTGAVNLGFAIPAATATDIAEQLRTTGRARHAFAGITPATLTAPVASELGLPVDTGVLITEVTPGGPANRAGITPGSVVRRVGATATPTVEAFLAALRPLGPGDQVAVTFVPPGKRATATVTVMLSDRPA